MTATSGDIYERAGPSTGAARGHDSDHPAAGSEASGDTVVTNEVKQLK
jgi:hypothetical protein